MSNKKKGLLVVVSSVLILALGAGAVALVSTSVANAQSVGFQRLSLKFSNPVDTQRFDGENRFPGKGPENDSYLAEALGISVEELQAAREKASAAAMEAAIQSGDITEEQASIMEARQALKGYIDNEALTATALGVTEEELQAAHEEGKSPRDLMGELGISEADFQAAMETAYKAAIQQAVEDGVITQEQADLILNSETILSRGGPGGLNGKGGAGDMQGRGVPAGFQGKGEKMDTYLAEALGISVEELQAAREKASDAAMEAAVESGEITEEQANLMEARQALKGYINQETLTASALGITVEELQSARDQGKSIRDLMDELGITEEDFQAAMKTAYEAVVQQAVEDGVVTQEQADLILNKEMNPGFGGPGGFPGMGNGEDQPGGPGQPGGQGPCQPGQNPPDMPGQRQNPPGGSNGFPGEPYSPTPEGDA